MIIRFRETYDLPLDEVYSHFRSPADWAQLFGFPGDSKELGDGWYSVSLHKFPFPLVAKHIEQEPNKLARWVFRGFWRGRGEAKLEQTSEGVTVEGFEEIAVRPLFFLSPLFERLFLDRGFRAIWGVGWRRLRRIEAAKRRSATTA